MVGNFIREDYFGVENSNPDYISKHIRQDGRVSIISKISSNFGTIGFMISTPTNLKVG